VGASNELPDSEELQALFDRFLLRKPVKQISAVGLVQMMTEASSAGRSYHELHSGRGVRSDVHAIDLMDGGFLAGEGKAPHEGDREEQEGEEVQDRSGKEEYRRKCSYN
jgi:hypothetical protein